MFISCPLPQLDAVGCVPPLQVAALYSSLSQGQGVVNSSRLLLTQGVHNALIVSLHLCKPTLLSSHQLLSLSTWSLSCQHWDPDKF